jgi:hypothetical protein
MGTSDVGPIYAIAPPARQRAGPGRARTTPPGRATAPSWSRTNRGPRDRGRRRGDGWAWDDRAEPTALAVGL